MTKDIKLHFYFFTTAILMIIVIYIYYKNQKETFINYKKCNYIKLNNAVKYILKKSNSINNDIDWELYLPCSYTRIEKELSLLNLKKNQSAFGITGSDMIASKNYLWKILSNYYGSKNSEFLYPKSYLPNNREHIKKFILDYDKNKSYILKKNLQQQKGLELCNDYNRLLKELTSSNVNIVQELLENPLLVNGRKINLRVYFLVVCQENEKKGYIHKDGFIYYTRKNYDKNILDFDHHITTGYVDRDVYEKNPLTHEDLYEFLEKNNMNSMKLKQNLYILMKRIFKAIKNNLCNKENVKQGKTFQLFGCDVAPDKDLNCILIEINKGPDMTFKDSRDGYLKKDVIGSIFNLLNIDKDMKDIKFDNQFIEL